MFKTSAVSRLFSILALATIIVGSTAGYLALQPTGKQIEASVGWLTGWSYRKSHAINAASGAGTNYQVKITVHYAGTSDFGADVYLNSHCRIDFGDVRFTKSDGSTLLDYWMESYTASDNAVFWVEVADDLSTTAQTIYIYYGKSDATTTSNFANTFIDHDDFEDGTDGQPPAGWTTSTGITLTVSTTATYVNKGTKGLRQLSNGGGTSNPAYRSLTTISGDKNRAIEFWIKVVTEQEGSYQYVLLGDGATIKFFFAMRYPDGGSRYISYHDGSAWVSVMPYVVGTWYRIKIYNIDFTNRKFDMDVDGVNKVAGGTFYAAATQFNRFMKAAGGGTTWDEALDTIFVRKCVSPEPSHGSWGSEETNNLPNAPTLSNPVAGYRYNPSASVTFSWTFSDPDAGDTQSAYQLQIGSSDFTIIYLDTGKVASTSSSTIRTLPSAVGLYYWRVKTWDNKDAEGPYSAGRIVIVDRIKITACGILNNVVDTRTGGAVWYTAVYESDSTPFTSTCGTLYLNGGAMVWATDRWTYTFPYQMSGSQAVFHITSVAESTYGLTGLNNAAGDIVLNWATMEVTINKP